MLPISHFTWQVLRAAKRSKKPAIGKDLRIVPNRRTKDGTFLDELVKDGLLQVVGQDDATEATRKVPVQFRTRYKLTTIGEYAAEYGEYEREVKRAGK
jgi:hypothetical protein